MPCVALHVRVRCFRRDDAAEGFCVLGLGGGHLLGALCAVGVQAHLPQQGQGVVGEQVAHVLALTGLEGEHRVLWRVVHLQLKVEVDTRLVRPAEDVCQRVLRQRLHAVAVGEGLGDAQQQDALPGDAQEELLRQGAVVALLDAEEDTAVVVSSRDDVQVRLHGVGRHADGVLLVHLRLEVGLVEAVCVRPRRRHVFVQGVGEVAHLVHRWLVLAEFALQLQRSQLHGVGVVARVRAGDDVVHALDEQQADDGGVPRIHQRLREQLALEDELGVLAAIPCFHNGQHLQARPAKGGGATPRHQAQQEEASRVCTTRTSRSPFSARSTGEGAGEAGAARVARQRNAQHHALVTPSWHSCKEKHRESSMGSMKANFSAMVRQTSCRGDGVGSAGSCSPRAAPGQSAAKLTCTVLVGSISTVLYELSSSHTLHTIFPCTVWMAAMVTCRSCRHVRGKQLTPLQLWFSGLAAGSSVAVLPSSAAPATFNRG